jgi:aspartate kinase
MIEIIVGKYGGTSITSEKDVRRIGRITKEDPRRRVIIVSAPNLSNEKRTTNMLIELGETRDESLIDPIVEQYSPFHSKSTSKRFRDELESRLNSGLPTPAFKANLAALGDEASAWFVAEKNDFVYIDPKELFRVTPDFSNGKILPVSMELIKKNLGKRIEQEKDTVYVIAGFSGATEDGLRVTFSRNGSNITSTYIAAALKAVLIETYTDIDGVYSANPRIVKNPRKIKKLTYDEMRDLSYAGFSVFNHEAVIPARKAKIPIEIKSASEPDKEGTYIVTTRKNNPNEPPFIGIAYKNGFSSIDVSSPGLNDITGVLTSLTNVFAQKGIPLEYTPCGIDDISLIFNSSKLQGNNPIRKLKKELYDLAGEEAKVKSRNNLGCIVVAGKNLKRKIGKIDSEIRGLLYDNKINVEFSEQGRERRCLIYGVDNKNGPKAVNLIYDKYLR